MNRREKLVGVGFTGILFLSSLFWLYASDNNQPQPGVVVRTGSIAVPADWPSSPEEIDDLNMPDGTPTALLPNPAKTPISPN